jgi:hypothetical protein
MYLLVILLASVFTLISILLFKVKNSVHQVLIFGLIATIIAAFYVILDYEEKKNQH